MHAAVLYRRERITAARGFDPNLRRCEDYDLYLRMSRRWPIGCHPDIIAEYRWHDHNMSHDIGAMLDTVLEVLGRQEEVANANEADYFAWRAGRRNWRDYYAEQLAMGSQPQRHGLAGLRDRAALWSKLLMTSPKWTMRKTLGAVKRRLRSHLTPDQVRGLRGLIGKGGPPHLAE